MKINQAEFIISNTDYKKCPEPNFPEYAFIGRSNVGKSSLINSLTGKKALAKISGTPGKTQLINHFLINQSWYLVDLPGYGYAKTSKGLRQKFKEINTSYVLKRENLICLFVLLDSRHEPQKVDKEYMEFLGTNGVPFAMVFTKCDKLTNAKLEKNIQYYKKEMMKTWEYLPEVFKTSSVTALGKEEILSYIDDVNKNVKL